MAPWSSPCPPPTSRQDILRRWATEFETPQTPSPSWLSSWLSSSNIGNSLICLHSIKPYHLEEGSVVSDLTSLGECTGLGQWKTEGCSGLKPMLPPFPTSHPSKFIPAMKNQRNFLCTLLDAHPNKCSSCQHRKMLQNYWPYSLCCTFIPVTNLHYWDFMPLYPLHLFPTPPQPLHHGNQSLLRVCEPAAILFILFCF